MKIEIKVGIGTLRFSEPTKVQKAFSIWFMYLHEGRFEFEEGAHPSWKGHRERTMERMKAIIDTMTDAERDELRALMFPNIKNVKA